jgi:glutamate-5-semialdehyde dehydrogenase
MAKKRSVTDLAKNARSAAPALAGASTGKKNDALLAYARLLETETAPILVANARDLTEAHRHNLAPAMVDRLRLDQKRLEGIAQGLREIVALPDPVGEISRMTVRPNGLRVGRMRVPLGVIAIIYESRPNVTADAAGLCIKSGNAVILRGGSEAIHSNTALARCAAAALTEAGLPAAAVQVVETTDRSAVTELLQLEGKIDLVIPRGGKSLVRTVVDNSRIPVIFHLDGVCHTYVDEGADIAMAVKVCFNAKVQRPGVCNAMETLLVHERIAPAFLRKMLPAYRTAGVEIRGCPKTRRFAPWVRKAVATDFGKEFLELVLAVKVVGSLEEATDHIARHGSMHTDAIITQDYERAMRFVNTVDSSSVMVNASTRFSDGFEYGLGAEMGISTQKLHARGPMGLEELTCQKFVVFGQGQVRE